MIKPEDIVNKVFSRSFMGYDMREVDALLDEVIDRLEAYEKEKKEMLAAMEHLLGDVERLERGAKALPQPAQQLIAPSKPGRPRGAMRVAPAQPPAEAIKTKPAAGPRRVSHTVSLEIETGAAAPPKRIVQKEMHAAEAAAVKEPPTQHHADASGGETDAL